MTGYGVGGAAEFYAEPPDEAALSELLRSTYAAGTPVRVLGEGWNLLVADGGVEGLVIRLPKPTFAAFSRETAEVRVGAAHPLPSFIAKTLKGGWGGLEGLAGIPGTVGGAAKMNAGGKYGYFGDFARFLRGYRFDGTPFLLRGNDCRFEYRRGGFGEGIVAECGLTLTPFANEGARARAHERLREIRSTKKAAQPLSARSAGCVFKNPGGQSGNGPADGPPPAGKLLDELGAKGLFCGRPEGGARVSQLHANFIVCEGAAKAGDVADLIRELRHRVKKERGLDLRLEIETWGFRPAELEA
jgi:UDP-N-acetylmuramate dehydrogenase